MPEQNRHRAERALFELRRGRPLLIEPARIDGAGGPLPAGDPGAEESLNAPVLVAAVEGIGQQVLDLLRESGRGPLRLILTPHRGGVMGLTDAPTGAAANGRPPGGPAAVNGNGRKNERQDLQDLSLGLDETADAEDLFQLASAGTVPLVDGSDLREATRSESGGVTLVRLGGLLPAVVCIPADLNAPRLAEQLATGAILRVTAAEIEAMSSAVAVEMLPVSGAVVPIQEAQDARFILFREAHGLQDHVAVLVGDPDTWPDPVPVRLHSACLTGDLFGSLKCDCGEQLRGSLRHFARSGGGVLLYLAQEGRGIGLGNKFRAYTLQDGGLDTVDADHALGFGADERRYDVAVAMLRQLGIARVQLLTNNPEKMKAVRDGGILVLERQPLHGTLNRYNLPYVRAKVHRAGHWLEEMLASKLPEE